MASGEMAASPAGRILSTHPETLLAHVKQWQGERGGGEIRPAGEKSHGAEACGDPTRWPS